MIKTLFLLACIAMVGCQAIDQKTHRSENGKPYIGGASVYGNKPDTPLLYTIAATGDRPMQFTAKDLPEGLSLDKNTGIISGTVETAGTYTVELTARNAAGKTSSSLALKIGDTLALTPPMGWMSWNQFGPNISEDLIKQIADAMVESGMRDAGYQYIFIDDHWHGKRDADGYIHPDPEKFPNGIKVLAEYVHSKGLKLGIYSDAAPKTCGGEPGSLGYEDKDAQTYAKWDIDYLKYDYCGAPKDQATAIKRYTTMADELAKTDRSIMFGICEWGRREPWLWAAEAGGNVWRTTWDIRDTWDHGPVYNNGHAGIVNILDRQVGLDQYAGPGRWNDPDMLVVGLHGQGLAASANGADGCSNDEYRSNMSLWCLMAAPLYASCDVRHMKPEDRAILTNTEAIAINQDPLGKAGYRAVKNGDLEIWVKPLAGNEWAVGLLNRSEKTADITANLTALGINGSFFVRDVWAHQDQGSVKDSVTRTVKPHETVLLRLVP